MHTTSLPHRMRLLLATQTWHAAQLHSSLLAGALVRLPDAVAGQAVGSYQDTARGARNGLLRHAPMATGLLRPQ